MQQPSITSKRQSALRALLAATIPAAGMYALFNMYLGAPYLGVLNVVLLLVSGVLFALPGRVPPQAAALIYLPVLFINVIVTMSRPDIHSGILAWISVIPVLPYLLLEVRLAFRLAVVALVAATGAYFAGIDAAPYRLEPDLIINTATVTLGLFIVCHFYSRSRVQSEARWQEIALQDPLTKLWNRDKLREDFEAAKRQARSFAMPLSLVLFDLDHFKHINDSYGHDAGDAVLTFFSELARKRMRKTDVLCRFGGEEFAVLMPDTDAASAGVAAEALRAALEASEIQYQDKTINATLSAGVAELGRDGADWTELYRCADKRLYYCKKNGRNQVAID